jgi:hypothetical protein
MKLVLCAAMGALLLVVGACQTDMTGPRPTPSGATLDNSPDNMHSDVAPGDVYLEEAIDRYNLTRD